MSRDNKGRFSKNHITQEEELTNEDNHINKKLTGFLEKPPSIKMIIVMIMIFWVLSMVSPRLADEFNSRIIQSYCKCQIHTPIEIDRRTAASNHTEKLQKDTEDFWKRPS